jgi:hypothetical protein
MTLHNVKAHSPEEKTDSLIDAVSIATDCEKTNNVGTVIGPSDLRRENGMNKMFRYVL